MRLFFAWQYSETVHQLFIDFKKAYDSVRREVLYSILIEIGVPMKLVRLKYVTSKVQELKGGTKMIGLLQVNAEESTGCGKVTSFFSID
jgi:hypothetical protein